MKSVRHDPEVQQALAAFRLASPRLPVAGSSGELLGRGTGSSLEFQEYREYLPGDDIRHVDWSAYARSDALMVRLYRDEISPRTEILLDASRSMTTGGEAKPRVARQLAALFALLSARVGGRPSVILLDDARPSRGLALDALDNLASLSFSGTATLDELIAENVVPLKRQAVRIVISDFLFPHDPDALVRRLSRESGALWLIQLLNAWEADPPASEGRRLIDVETQGTVDLLLDRKTVSSYRERLSRVQEELGRSCRCAHGRFVTLIADRGLPALCRSDLCSAGLLVPAA
ncbi:MAG TPA: DUF58 domain-containing protein [Planctomycetaceae bacterium]|nr:DUF58 domain-containing protein [Planctomycetaceae bacterium]